MKFQPHPNFTGIRSENEVSGLGDLRIRGYKTSLGFKISLTL